ncbi:MAG: glycosyltransferase family 4 protein [Cyclobacteriaceae bacterium]
MRVLIMVGAEKPPVFIANLVYQLADRGIHVGLFGKNTTISPHPNISFVHSDYTTLSDFRILGYIIISVFYSPLLVYKAFGLVDHTTDKKVRIKMLFRLIKILRFAPDVIHIQWPIHANYLTKFIQSKVIKFIISLRGSQINVKPYTDVSVNKLYQQIFPFCYFHSVSENLKIKSLAWHANKEKVKVIYSPVSHLFLDAFVQNKQKRSSSLRILSIGRFHWVKGYNYAIEAIKILKAKNVECNYTIVADNEVPAELLYQIKDAGLTNTVSIRGGVLHDKIPLLLRDYDVFLLPSVEEGIANVVIEAMAQGLPVISTNCGGINELIANGQNGWLVPVRDPHAMAQAIEEFSWLPVATVDEIRNEAHLAVKKKFSTENIDHFIGFYKWVISQE